MSTKDRIHGKSFIAFIVLACSSLASSNADNIDECILRSMAGVSSDAAARLVAKACRSKIDEAHRENVAKTFGIELSAENYALSDKLDAMSDGHWAVKLTNISKSTITYAKLSVKDGDYFNYKVPPGKTGIDAALDHLNWESDRDRIYEYQITLRPGNTIALVFEPHGGGAYTAIKSVFGRSQKWTDSISLSDEIAAPQVSNSFP